MQTDRTHPRRQRRPWSRAQRSIRRRPHDVIDPRGVQTGERCQGTRCDIARNSVRILRIDLYYIEVCNAPKRPLSLVNAEKRGQNMNVANGTWKLNVAKSKYTPGPLPKSATITYEETVDGIKRTGGSVDAGGKTTPFEYNAKYDGKDYPVTGQDLYDTITIKRIDDQTAESTLKKSGKAVSNARRVISKDGKVMTLTVTGTNPKGDKMQNVAIYEKQ